jgi:hypothetical protein
MAGSKKRKPRAKLSESESALHTALTKSVRPWTSLQQLGFSKDAKGSKKALEALVAAGRVIELGTVERTPVYAAVRSGSADDLRLSLATQAAKNLVQGNRLVLLPLQNSNKVGAPYTDVPTLLRGTIMVRALQTMAQKKEAFLVKVGKTTYAALSDNFRQLLSTGPNTEATRKRAATPKGSKKKKTNIERSNVIVAYRRLSQTQRSPDIMIADLVRETGAPLDTFKEWLLGECRAHRAIPFLGEPARASQEQLAAALPVNGRPHIYIRFVEEDVS